jgi:hypothetical protein
MRLFICSRDDVVTRRRRGESRQGLALTAPIVAMALVV